LTNQLAESPQIRQCLIRDSNPPSKCCSCPKLHASWTAKSSW